MIRLAFLLFVVVGPVMAGIAVLVATSAPQLGLESLSSMGWVAGAGFLIGLPISFVLAKMLPADLMGNKA